MKKNSLIIALFAILSSNAFSQGYYDMYYTPSDDNDPNKELLDEISVSEEQEINSSERDVDEYNRRYSSSYEDNGENENVVYEDGYSDDGWVNGFNGSQSDYEYSKRLIRLNSPSIAVHVSSPYYWDIVYGTSSFDWNVYVDGNYAYAFPTFSNPLWWDWRYSRPYYGYYNWYSPYYYGGWYGSYCPGWYAGGYWYHHMYNHYYPYYPYYASRPKPVYYDNNRTGSTSKYNRRTGTTSSRGDRGTTYVRRSSVESSYRNSSENRYETTRRRASYDNSFDYDESSRMNSSFDSPRRSYQNNSTTNSFSRPSSTSSYRTGWGGSSNRSGGYTPSSRSGSRR